MSDKEAWGAVTTAPGTRSRRALRRCRTAWTGYPSVLLAGEHDAHDSAPGMGSRPGPGPSGTPAPQAAAVPAPPEPSGDTGYADVLVVDDDADVRSSMVAILRGHGFSVVEASDGQSALDTMDVTRVGVLVLDLHMTPRDGVWLLEHLQDPPAVILVSAFALFSEADMRERFSGLVSHFVVKPVRPPRLISLVQDALGRRPS